MHSSVFLGSSPVYVLADMDLFKEVTVKHFDKFVDRMVSDLASLLPSCAVMCKCLLEVMFEIIANHNRLCQIVMWNLPAYINGRKYDCDVVTVERCKHT